jgi:hypothetical protein
MAAIAYESMTWELATRKRIFRRLIRKRKRCLRNGSFNQPHAERKSLRCVPRGCSDSLASVKSATPRVRMT